MEIEDVFRKLKPVMGDDLDILWQQWILGDQVVRKMIEQYLRITLFRQLDTSFEENGILLEPPPRERVEGEYPLGGVYYGKEKFCRFGLREEEWIQHVGIFGRSGSGKTNVGFLVLFNWLRKGKPFLVFDWKRNYRDLLALRRFRSLKVFTVGREVAPFYFNPLIPPPGTQTTVWLKKLIEIMCHAYFLGEGVAYLLQEALDSVYQECKGGDRWPTLADVRDHLRARNPRGREGAWMESALRAVGVLCYGEVGKVLNHDRPTDIAKLLDERVLLELDALTNTDKTFFIEALLLWIHHYRLAQGGRETFKHGIVIEEAHHVLLRKKQEVTGAESVTDVILREIRELGEAVVVLDQHPSLISKPALGNTYCTICMNLKHRGDIAMIADSILLDSEKARYLGGLEVGWGMVKLQGRWFRPFLVKFPYVKVKKGVVRDEDICQGGSKPSGFEIHERQAPEAPKEDLRRDSALRSGILPPAEERKIEVPVRNSGKCLSANENRFLEDIRQDEFSPVRNRYFRLGFSSYSGNKLKNSLLSQDLIFEKLVCFGQSRIKLLGIKEKGKGVIGGESAADRKGDLEHRFYMHKAAEALERQDYVVQKEFPLGEGKTADLVAVRGNEKIAVEVETGKSDPEKNLTKCLAAGFERVLLIPTNPKVRLNLEELSRGGRYQGVEVVDLASAIPATSLPSALPS